MSASFPHLLSPAKVSLSDPRGKNSCLGSKLKVFHPQGLGLTCVHFFTLPPLKLRCNIPPGKVVHTWIVSASWLAFYKKIDMARAMFSIHQDKLHEWLLLKARFCVEDMPTNC